LPQCQDVFFKFRYKNQCFFAFFCRAKSIDVLFVPIHKRGGADRHYKWGIVPRILNCSEKRRSNMRYTNENKKAPLPLILLLCLLLTLFSLPASAKMTYGGAKRASEGMADCCTAGTVTDTDGIIGNGTRGADAPYDLLRSAMGRVAKNAVRGVGEAAGDIGRAAGDAARDIGRGVGNAVEDMTGGNRGNTTNGVRGMEGNGDRSGMQGRDGSQSEQDNADSGITAQDGAGAETENATTDGGGVIGWVIALLVILGIALVVLALLPKKKHERR
jgi:hypothetical protein